MKTATGNGKLLFISLILAVFLSGTALADVQLDLGSYPLYPDDAEVFPGDEVQIPIFLSNYPNGPTIVATGNEITYDSEFLTPLVPAMGPAGQTAGKNIRSNIIDLGVYIVGVLGTTEQNLNTPIPDGIVAYVKFRINDTAPAGTYILGNTPECTTPDGKDIPVSGTDGFIEVSGTNSITTTTEPVTTIPTTSSTTTTEPVTTISITSTTTTSIATTTVPSTTTTSVPQVVCTITINPSFITVASNETVHFTATATDTECANPQLVWSVDSAINSTIDDDGNYQAGENNTGEDVTDTVLVTDNANNNSATATVSVSALPIGEINRIAPNTIYSSRRRARLHLLIIRSDQGNFKNTSALSFKPEGDISTLTTIAAGKIMLAFVSVKPNVQGQYDVTIATDDMIYTKKDGLNVNIGPLFSSNKIKQKSICSGFYPKHNLYKLRFIRNLF